MQKTEKADLQSLFSHQLIIPPYQRAYSWNEKQVRQFFEDLEYAIKNDFEESSEKYHYFGTVVLEEKEDKYKDGGNAVERYDIVDGQQRIITTSILGRVLIDILGELRDNQRLNEDELQVEELQDSIRNQFIDKQGMLRIKPEDISEDAYESLVVNGQIEESYNSLAGRNMKTAYDVLHSNLETYLNESSDDSGEYVNEEILKLIRTFKTEFRVTPNILTDMNEASRMFKVINDRGKDLTPIDKIKSHLMYCCTFLEDFKPEKVSRLINNSIQKITSVPHSTEKDIQNFARIHWYLFTAENSDDWHKAHDRYEFSYRPDLSYYERLQELPFYASTSRDKKHLRSFVGHYVKSMNDIVDSFIKFQYPEYARKKGMLTNEESNYIYTLHQSSIKFSYGVYVTSLLYALDNRQNAALKLAIRPAIRYNQIMKHSGSFSRLFLKQGHKLFWLQYESITSVPRDDLIGNRRHQMYEIPPSKGEWINSTEILIENKISERASDSAINEYLNEPDILDGEFTDGWGGLRSDKIAKILLYYYEDHLRNEKLHTHKTLKDWCESLELEHILPQNPKEGEGIPHHKEQVNRLGNLLVLTSDENKEAQNLRFDEKIDTIYPNSYDSIEMIRELDKYGEWNSSTIKERSQSITNFVVENL